MNCNWWTWSSRAQNPNAMLLFLQNSEKGMYFCTMYDLPVGWTFPPWVLVQTLQYLSGTAGSTSLALFPTDKNRMKRPANCGQAAVLETGDGLSLCASEEHHVATGHVRCCVSLLMDAWIPSSRRHLSQLWRYFQNPLRLSCPSLSSDFLLAAE